jgi:hypothetical protein
MTDERKDREPEVEEESPALKALLKRSLAEADAPAPPKQDDAERKLLSAVQRKIRKRSKGKFYADGWSTSSSKMNYALVALVMLVTIVAVYLALGPMGITR